MLFSPRPLHCGTCLSFFYREEALAISSLVDSRRLARTASATKNFELQSPFWGEVQGRLSYWPTARAVSTGPLTLLAYC